MRIRVGVLLALTLLLPGTAAAEPTPCVPPLCRTASPTPSPTPTRTTSPTPEPTPTFSPTPQRTSFGTRSPEPRRTSTPTPTPSPQLTDPPPGGLLPSPTPVAVTPANERKEGQNRVDQLVLLILAAAVLLGIGGISGLYLTRTREEHGS